MMLKAEVYCPTSGRGLKHQKSTVERHLWREKIDVVWSTMTFNRKMSKRQKTNKDYMKLMTFLNQDVEKL